MKTIIAGSREITDYDILEEAVASSNFAIDKIIVGGARGVDSLAEWYAIEHEIPYDIMPALWDTYGKAAGPIRNEAMANTAEALIAVWDGESKGTAHMIKCARRKRLKVFVWLVD